VTIALATVYVIWGSTYLAIAYVVETLPPFLAAGSRFLVAGALILGFLWARERLRHARGPSPEPLERPTGRHWRSALVVGGLLLVGGNGLVMAAERTVPSGVAAVIIATVPIWMTTFEAFLDRRWPGLVAVIGLVVGLGGVALLVQPSGVDALDPVGVGLLSVATLSWAAGSLVARRWPMPRHQLVGSGMQQLAGGALLVLTGLALGELTGTDFSAVSRASVLGLAYLVVFGSLLGFTAYFWLLGNVSVTTVGTYAYVNPIVAVALGMLFRGESLSARALVAAGLTIAGVVAMVSGRPGSAPPRGGAVGRSRVSRLLVLPLVGLLAACGGDPTAPPETRFATTEVGVLTTGSPGKDEDPSVLRAADGSLYVAWFSDRTGTGDSSPDRVDRLGPGAPRGLGCRSRRCPKPRVSLLQAVTPAFPFASVR
jgi:drug/metabolite transporter (DMT)-like permease